VLPDGRLKNSEMFSGTDPVAARKCADDCVTAVVVVVLVIVVGGTVVAAGVVGAAELPPPHDTPAAKRPRPAPRHNAGRIRLLEGPTPLHLGFT
jgi:hypothetical protein